MQVVASQASIDRSASLLALIDAGTHTLMNARSAAEVLEVRNVASAAYDLAKRSARLAAQKDAHDTVVAAAHRAQANALELEAAAKRRLADEYDAAQERGEVAVASDKLRRGPAVPKENDGKPTAASLGLSRKDIHEAREIRDAEKAEPGIVRRTLNEALDNREEPTRAKVRRAVKAKSQRKRGRKFVAPAETAHDRDLRALLGIWEASCQSARDEFLKIISKKGSGQ